MDTGGGGSLRAGGSAAKAAGSMSKADGSAAKADASVSPAGANMPLATVGFMVVLFGAGSALWAVRRRPRAGQHAAGRPRR